MRTAVATDDVDVSFQIAEVLVRLRQLVQPFPDASIAPPLTAHKYVSMEAMLSTSPSVGSGNTSSNGGNQEAQVYASLYLSIENQKGCQELIDIASKIYITAFALSSEPRKELLQVRCASN